MKVKATDQYQKRGMIDAGLGYIPKPDEVFEISEERFKMLNGDNIYNAIFVIPVEEKKIETASVKPQVEKAVKAVKKVAKKAKKK